MQTKGPATRSLPKEIPTRLNTTEQTENGPNTEAANTPTSKISTQKPNEQYDAMSEDDSEEEGDEDDTDSLSILHTIICRSARYAQQRPPRGRRH